MPFEAYKIYDEYEPNKYKTSTQKKVEQALDIAKKENLIPEAKETNIEFNEARELFGKDFLGPESVKTTYGVELTPEELQEIENIPFTREELEQAKHLKMMLVLRVSHDKDGNLLTIKQLREQFGSDDALGDPAKKKTNLFWKSQDWYNDQEFATKPTPQLKWSLVTKDVLQESLDKNWDQQEEVLKKWAKDNNIDPNTIKRRTPVEIIYDTLLYYGANKESLLESTWDWSAVQSSDGSFVDVGSFDSGGLDVSDDTRDGTSSSLGVCPSR
ncbi:MAG: hypothetical protein KGI50_00670 [Patescibacteria group bacterium]|nr:hypothetical protein [Patescibacteria group bacterium]MDE2438133.1 hypothetical protein [Patescibacteria group bacterium]